MTNERDLDGFPNVGPRGEANVLWVDSTRISDSMTAAARLGVTYIGVSPEHGFHLSGLDFLKEYPEVERLFLPFAERYDLRPLRELRGLRHLTIAGSTQEIDVGWFPALEELLSDWHPKLRLENARRLTRLCLRNFAGGEDLNALPALPSLQWVELNGGRLTSFAGAERYPSLQRLETFYLRRLTRVADLCAVRRSLKFLTITNSPAVADHETLACLSALETLRLNRSGRIPSLGFLDSMTALSEFRFNGTLIEDGDLRPVLRLRVVGFAGKRGYSHSPKQVDALIAARKEAD